MKKLLAILLVAVMMVSVTACGGDKEKKAETASVEITDSLEILNKVWATYAEDELFPVGGGDSANLNWEGPGKFDVAATEELTANYVFPADYVSEIDDAATMMHAMMANNFTAGVYHLIDASDMEAVTTAMETSILENQWLCGMPEKMVIITVEDYVIAAFGLTDLIDTFTTKLTTEYPTATVVCEENIG